MRNPIRKIMCAALLAASGVLAIPGAAGAQVQLQRAELAQKGRELGLLVRTSAAVGLGKADPHPGPRRPAARSLCFEFSSDPSAPPQRYCLGGRKAHQRIGYEQVNPVGRPSQESWVRATVKRPQPQKLVVALVPREAALSPERYGWRAIRSGGWAGLSRCAEAFPAVGTASFRLRPVRAVGC